MTARLKDSDRGHWRPATRRDCEQMARPCPFVGCRYHLALDVTKDVLKRTTPAKGRTLSPKASSASFAEWSDALVAELKRMEQTCSLDVAESGGLTLDHTGKLMSVTRERTRQIENRAIHRIRRTQEKES